MPTGAPELFLSSSARTGQRFLAGLTSDEAMFRYLMDNAIASKQALNLSVGISLTAEQVAALTHDLVWLEEYEVNGEKVLVPVLYLAQAEGRLAPNGALIQGRDVTLISGGELNNQGTLRASGNLDLSAGNIHNTGLMQAGERLSLLAVDSIRNAQGGIIAGRDVSAIALTGDIVNERSVTTHESAERGYTHREDFVSRASRIEAANDLSLGAGRDIQNIGGALIAGRDLKVDAGRDLLIVSAQEHDLTKRVARKSNNRLERITQHASDISAGRDLTLSTERDLAVVASRVNAGQDLALVAGGDATIASAANESHYEAHRRGGGKKVDIERSTVTQQGAELSAGGALHVEAGHDLTAVASELEAGGEAYLYAGNDLSLLAAEDSDYHLYDYKKKGSWGSKKTQRDEVTDVRNVGTQITSGGDLSLVSEGDQTYQRAHLESGEDLTLESGGEIAFEGVKDLKQESHEKSDSGFVWTSAKGKGNTDETLRQSVLLAQGEVVIKAVEGLKIDIKQVNQQTVSQTIDAMVKADPQLAWLKEAELRGDVDWRRVKEIHESFKYEHSGLGGGAAIIIAIVMSVITAGAGTAIAAAAGGAVGGGTVGAVVGAVAQGAFHASVAQTAISTINNKGNPLAVIKDTHSAESIKGYAVAGITAGITAGVVNKAWGVSTEAAQTANKGFDLGTVDGAAKYAGYSATNATVQAGVGTAIQGGSFSDNLQGALVSQAQNVAGALAFNAVGDYTQGIWADGSPQKIALHALVGGLLSEAAGGDFATGAAAAGANEALVNQLNTLVDGNENLLLMASQLVGLTAAGLVDGDLQQGADIAASATTFNFLNHRDVEELEEKAKKCAANGSCDDLDAEAKARSLANHQRLLACQEIGNCAEIRAEIDAGSFAINALESQLPDGAASRILRSYTFIGGDNLNDWNLAGQLHLSYIADLYHANDPRWQIEASKYTEQTGFNPFGISAAGLGGLASGKSPASATKVTEPAKTTGTTAGETTPKWDNAVSRADGDFGPLNQPVKATAGSVKGQATPSFPNQFPDHPTGAPTLISDTKLTQGAGKYNYVVLENGQLIIGRKFNDVGGGHIDLANGKPVIAAGEVKVVSGKVKYIDNTSGHYEPSGRAAQAAAENAFSQKGLDVAGKYIEKVWVPDTSNPRTGAWVPK